MVSFVYLTRFSFSVYFYFVKWFSVTKKQPCSVFPACTCKHNDTMYKYGEIIYHTTDGLQNCIIAICAEDGNINKTVEPCETTVAPTVPTTPLTTTPTPTTVFVFTTPGVYH